MAPTAETFPQGSPMNPGREPSQKDDLEQALGAAAEAGKQEDDEGEVNPEYQGDIAADDAGGTRMAEEIERELRPTKPPGEASG